MRSNLAKRGFISLIVTQFFGAANDNILKGVLTFMVIDGIWTGRLGAGGQGIIGLCFTVPFVLLSGYAGQFADRYSKRTVSVLVKTVEIPISLIALAGFFTGNLWITLGALIALTCQSSFFGPAKYGMIPELVDSRDLSRANGTINMLTNIAVIAGMYYAGVISDLYAPKNATGPSSVGLLWLPGVVMVAIALAGLAAVQFLTKLKPGDRDLRFDWNPFGSYVRALREMAESPLLMVALAWGYFYLLAGMAMLIIPEYAVVLGIEREEAAKLLAIMAIGIGVGSVAAGLISGHRIEPRLVPIGALGLSFFMILLGLIPPTFWGVAAFVAGAGVFAGFYIIPLQAMLQRYSPDDERGRFLGTANAVSFTFLSVAGLLYWLIRPAFGSQPQKIFLICAVLMLGGAAFFLIRLRHTAFKRGEE